MSIRACYYTRVSTDEEKQVNALVKQCTEAKECINNNGWTLAGEYIDEGKSGTTINKRDAYNSLFEDIALNKFDIIVIKSQDRLMRNVRDWYLFISHLIEHGKKLYIYMDNKFYQSDDNLITGIKAILAEEYSRDLSRKINKANRTRQRSGSSIITNNTMWGYRQENGELIIDEYEANIIRQIFSMYVDGYGIRQIKSAFDRDNVVSRRGTQISLTTLKRIIKNPKYKGTVVCNQHHKDFDTKRIKSVPQDEWITHEDRIPAIIDEETWAKANAIMESKRYRTKNSLVVGCNKGTHSLSGKIVCGECGRSYHHTFYNLKTKNGKVKTPYWICATYQEKGRLHPRGKDIGKTDGCDGFSIKEDQLMSAITEYASSYTVQLDDDIDNALAKLKSYVLSDTQMSDASKIGEEIEKIKKQKSFLLDRFLNGVVSEDDYTHKNEELDTKIQKLLDKQKQAIDKDKNKIDIERRLIDLREYIKSHKIAEAKRNFVIDNISKIEVFAGYANIDIGSLGSFVSNFNSSGCDHSKTASISKSK